MDTGKFLTHHGIKGQKWGIRHDPKTGRVSVDHRVAADLRRRPVSSLSNKQVQTANTRGELERKFAQLNPGIRQRGESHIRTYLATASLITSIAGLLNSPPGRALMNVGKKSAKKTLKIAGPRTFT